MTRRNLTGDPTDYDLAPRDLEALTHEIAVRGGGMAFAPLARLLARAARTFESAHDTWTRDQTARQRRRAEQNEIAARVRMIATYVVNGMSQEQALGAVAAATGINPEALRVTLPKVKRQLAALKRIERNARIMKYYRRGFTNREIAEKVTKPDGSTLHEKAIARIIGQEKRDAVIKPIETVFTRLRESA